MNINSNTIDQLATFNYFPHHNNPQMTWHTYIEEKSNIRYRVTELPDKMQIILHKKNHHTFIDQEKIQEGRLGVCPPPPPTPHRNAYLRSIKPYFFQNLKIIRLEVTFYITVLINKFCR